MGRPTGRWRQEAGQAVPLVAAVVVVIGVLGFAVARLGRRLTDAARAQSAADAAALAGAVDDRPGAAELATENGGVLDRFQRLGDDVIVTVEVEGAQAQARARLLVESGGGGDGPVVGGWALAVPRQAVGSSAWVSAPHHDYPALDLPVPIGTPVYAVAEATVRWVTDGRCGVGVSLQLSASVRVVYCHGSGRTAPNGSRVRAGQQVLRSGNSGNSTGPHLHIGVFVDGQSRCPQRLLAALLAGRPPPDPRSLPASGCTS